MMNLQYITQDTTKASHSELAERACRAGVRWIQLRMKTATDEEFLQEGRRVKQICRNYGARLILNDKVQLVEQLNADGVHVGLSDMPVAEVKKIIGTDKIVGGTANTLTDVIKHAGEGAHYVGVGPFAFTTTKKDLSPILGLQGYRELIEALNKENIEIPVIAIGGIRFEDIGQIMATGVDGIAVSSLITQHPKPRLVVEAFKNQETIQQ